MTESEAPRVALAVSGPDHDYGQLAALRGIGIEVRRGETIALVGPSGCGKSTLLEAIVNGEVGRLGHGVELAYFSQHEVELDERGSVLESWPTPGFDGASFLEVTAKSALNHVAGDGFMGGAWTINPYRGCQHACRYCFARNTHTYLDLDAGADFDSRIVVKANLVEVLERELAGTATWSEPEGGYFLWVDIPADAAELLVRAEAAGVTFVKGADFFPDGSGTRAARLAFSYASPSEIGEGVSTLASLLRA